MAIGPTPGIVIFDFDDRLLVDLELDPAFTSSERAMRFDHPSSYLTRLDHVWGESGSLAMIQE